MSEPSPAYFDALEASKAHHAGSKTFSGRFLRPHAPFIKEIIDRLGCTSVLDYGAGKGTQYEWVMPVRGVTLEEFWGVPVTKYDPAWPPYAKEPEGPFDLVLCTHVLGSIPLTDLPWVIDRLYALAARALYVAEKIGPLKKKVFSDPKAMPHDWRPEQWRESLYRRSRWQEVTLATRERIETDEVLMEHWRLTADVHHWTKVETGIKPFDHRTA